MTFGEKIEERQAVGGCQETVTRRAPVSFVNMSNSIQRPADFPLAPCRGWLAIGPVVSGAARDIEDLAQQIPCEARTASGFEDSLGSGLSDRNALGACRAR